MSASTTPATIAQTSRRPEPVSAATTTSASPGARPASAASGKPASAAAARRSHLPRPVRPSPAVKSAVEAARARLRLEEPEEVVAGADPLGKRGELREAAGVAAVLGRRRRGGRDRARRGAADVDEPIRPGELAERVRVDDAARDPALHDDVARLRRAASSRTSAGRRSWCILRSDAHPVSSSRTGSISAWPSRCTRARARRTARAPGAPRGAAPRGRRRARRPRACARGRARSRCASGSRAEALTRLHEPAAEERVDADRLPPLARLPADDPLGLEDEVALGAVERRDGSGAAPRRSPRPPSSARFVSDASGNWFALPSVWVVPSGSTCRRGRLQSVHDGSRFPQRAASQK